MSTLVRGFLDVLNEVANRRRRQNPPEMKLDTDGKVVHVAVHGPQTFETVLHEQSLLPIDGTLELGSSEIWDVPPTASTEMCTTPVRHTVTSHVTRYRARVRDVRVFRLRGHGVTMSGGVFHLPTNTHLDVRGITFHGTVFQGARIKNRASNGCTVVVSGNHMCLLGCSFKDCGVLATTGSDARLEDCTFASGSGSGAAVTAVHRSSTMTLSECSITGYGQGLSLAMGAFATCCGTTFCNTTYATCAVHSAVLHLEDCLVESSQEVGVWVCGVGARLLARRTTVTNCLLGLVVATKEAHVDLRDGCVLRGATQGNGLSVTRRAVCRAERCDITTPGLIGVCVSRAARATLAQCEIKHARIGAVVSGKCSLLELQRGCEVRDVEGSGVKVATGAHAKLTGSWVSFVGEYGVVVEDERSSVQVARAGFRKTGTAVLFCGEGTLAAVARSECMGHGWLADGSGRKGAVSLLWCRVTK